MKIYIVKLYSEVLGNHIHRSCFKTAAEAERHGNKLRDGYLEELGITYSELTSAVDPVIVDVIELELVDGGVGPLETIKEKDKTL